MTTILSIQSSVAYGHVGNSAATFPLMRMGVEVWPVLTVHFSNHTGYPGWRGPLLRAEDGGRDPAPFAAPSLADLEDLLAGLRDGGLPVALVVDGEVDDVLSSVRSTTPDHQAETTAIDTLISTLG